MLYTFPMYLTGIVPSKQRSLLVCPFSKAKMVFRPKVNLTKILQPYLKTVIGLRCLFNIDPCRITIFILQVKTDDIDTSQVDQRNT